LRTHCYRKLTLDGCWRTTDGAFCILASPLVRPRNGPLSKLREAFPWETAPRYLLHDRDRIFGADFVKQVTAMGIKQVLAAPRSPWKRAYVESIRFRGHVQETD
jgi:hypothetical protein